MKYIRKINESSQMGKLAICITIPKSISWDEYKKELKEVEDGSHEMNFKVPNLPKNINVGDRCYLCYNGNIIGWMKISSLGTKKFNSTVGGQYWEGKFISRSGKFNSIKPVPCQGFRGFKYIRYFGDTVILDK